MFRKKTEEIKDNAADSSEKRLKESEHELLKKLSKQLFEQFSRKAPGNDVSYFEIKFYGEKGTGTLGLYDRGDRDIVPWKPDEFTVSRTAVELRNELRQSHGVDITVMREKIDTDGKTVTHMFFTGRKFDLWRDEVISVEERI